MLDGILHAKEKGMREMKIKVIFTFSLSDDMRKSHENEKKKRKEKRTEKYHKE